MGRRIDPSWGGPIELFLHDWYNKGRGMCYPVCGMVHIKEPLLLIDKSSLCGGSGFPFSLSEWSLTICPVQVFKKQVYFHSRLLSPPYLHGNPRLRDQEGVVLCKPQSRQRPILNKIEIKNNNFYIILICF